MVRTVTKQVNIPQSKAEGSAPILEAIQSLIESESPQTLKRIGEKLKAINNPPQISSDEEQLATLLGGRKYSAEEKKELQYLNLINSYQRRRQLLSDTVTSSEIAKILGCGSRQIEFRGAGAMKAGSGAALSSIPDRKLSQAWSRYFYDNCDLYGEIDGIIFSNAHNQDTAIALYERAEPKLQAARIQSIPLAAESLQHLIAECALDNGLIFL